MQGQDMDPEAREVVMLLERYGPQHLPYVYRKMYLLSEEYIDEISQFANDEALAEATGFRDAKRVFDDLALLVHHFGKWPTPELCLGIRDTEHYQLLYRLTLRKHVAARDENVRMMLSTICQRVARTVAHNEEALERKRERLLRFLEEDEGGDADAEDDAGEEE